MVALIKNGESTFFSKSSQIKSLHKVNLDGRDYCVVYDKSRSAIVTIHPQERLEREERKLKHRLEQKNVLKRSCNEGENDDE